MLGSLARKLRLYGFDVLYAPDREDSSLLRDAKELRRLLLTSDEDLFRLALRKEVPALIIAGGTDIQRLVEVFTGIGTLPPRIRPLSSRCPKCNGRLRLFGKEDSLRDLPKRLLESQKRLYICGTCGKVYWEGSHWKRIKEIERSVATAVQEP